MERVAVIANQKRYASRLANDLKNYFGKYVYIQPYSMNEVNEMDVIPETYIVISAFTIFQAVRKKTDDHSRLLIADLTLDMACVERLYHLPKNARALLVNIDYRSCMEVITLLYSAGFQSLELIPYYPGLEFDPSIKIAITPDERELVPPGINTVIDIGQRVLNTSFIMEVADVLGIESPFGGKEAQAARKRAFAQTVGMEKVLGEKENLTEQIEGLLKMVRQGFLITDVSGRICLSNDKARQLLNSRTDVLVGFNIAEILPEFVPASGHAVGDSVENRAGELITLNGVALIVTASPIVSGDTPKGHVIMLESFTETESRQHKMRNKMTGSGHRAVYHFYDILGDSRQIHETKEIAMRMAKSDSSVALHGESGTGKELFAQSIHNHSDRRDYLFVAVNCSAFPENLLESELYGYEEGAFSGARKGGKIGLFELAHKGTLFLDEIGELPLSLQAKLLRAIEEHKILRVGGMDMIDVDVRIITATNRDLAQMVREKKFRSDLYYRLNTLPIHIPSLRERKEDIIPLFETFRRNMGVEFSLLPDARRRLIDHRWEGNVRELKNIVEYLANLGSAEIRAEDLPFKEEEALRAGSSINESGWSSAEGRNAALDGSTYAAGREAGPAGGNPDAVSGNADDAERYAAEWNEDAETRNTDAAGWNAALGGSELNRGRPGRETGEIRRFLQGERRREELYIFLLEELLAAYNRREHIGRNRLVSRAEQRNLFITEQEIKTGLARLNAHGFISSGRGRGGSMITEEGIRLLQTLRNDM